MLQVLHVLTSLDATIPAGSRVKLNHGSQGAWVRPDGTFTMYVLLRILTRRSEEADKGE